MCRCIRARWKANEVNESTRIWFLEKEKKGPSSAWIDEACRLLTEGLSPQAHEYFATWIIPFTHKLGQIAFNFWSNSCWHRRPHSIVCELAPRVIISPPWPPGVSAFRLWPWLLPVSIQECTLKNAPEAKMSDSGTDRRSKLGNEEERPPPSSRGGFSGRQRGPRLHSSHSASGEFARSSAPSLSSPVLRPVTLPSPPPLPPETERNRPGLLFLARSKASPAPRSWCSCFLPLWSRATAVLFTVQG